MDPDETLRQLREYAGEVINMRSDDLEDDDPRSNELALAEAFVALDEWLAKGGFLPATWTPQRADVYVLLTDDDDGTALIRCADLETAERVGAAAVLSDGGVSAWQIPRAAIDATVGAVPLTDDEAAELTRLEVVFEETGGRGVELAERIDQLRAKRDQGTIAEKLQAALQEGASCGDLEDQDLPWVTVNMVGQG